MMKMDCLAIFGDCGISLVFFSRYQGVCVCVCVCGGGGGGGGGWGERNAAELQIPGVFVIMTRIYQDSVLH